MDADRLAEIKERNRGRDNDARVLVAEVERLQAENGLLRRSLDVLAKAPPVEWHNAPRGSVRLQEPGPPSE